MPNLLTLFRYLIRNNYIHTPDVECDMATRCCVYLSMPEFEIVTAIGEIEDAVLEGIYAFVDYAGCFWALYLESALSELDQRNVDRFSTKDF